MKEPRNDVNIATTWKLNFHFFTEFRDSVRRGVDSNILESFNYAKFQFARDTLESKVYEDVTYMQTKRVFISSSINSRKYFYFNFRWNSNICYGKLSGERNCKHKLQIWFFWLERLRHSVRLWIIFSAMQFNKFNFCFKWQGNPDEIEFSSNTFLTKEYLYIIIASWL